jgi:NADPH-dependent glutamate synthase beta subunit-like oxidoreductase
MSAPKETLRFAEEHEEPSETREVSLRDGRRLVLSEQGNDQLVEIRSESGMLEVRIQLTEAGPVLQMEAVRMQLKAQESVQIEAKRVDISGTEMLALTGGTIAIASEQDTTVEAKGEVRVVGTMIYLN